MTVAMGIGVPDISSITTPVNGFASWAPEIPGANKMSRVRTRSTVDVKVVFIMSFNGKSVKQDVPGFTC